MISERYFAKNYPAFWKEVFPLANIFTRGMILESSQDTQELIMDTVGRRLSFISELGFMLFCEALKNEYGFLDKISVTDNVYKSIEQQCVSQFEIFSDDSETLNSPLTAKEFNDSIKIANRLYGKFKSLDSVVTNPFFNGCGLIDNCYGDVLAEDTLYEIKSVNRNFNIQDFRQIVTYCAMNYASKQYIIKFIALYNPRRDSTYRINVNSFAESISGNSFNEMCWKIIYFLSEEPSSK